MLEVVYLFHEMKLLMKLVGVPVGKKTEFYMTGEPKQVIQGYTWKGYIILTLGSFCTVSHKLFMKK